MRIISEPPDEFEIQCQHCFCKYAIHQNDIAGAFSSFEYDTSYFKWDCPRCGVKDFRDASAFPHAWREAAKAKFDIKQ